MPIGCFSLPPHVVSLLLHRRPASILDLGIGMGIYGAAVRQWLDDGRAPWRTRLVGVEGWGAYRNPTWDLYDEVRVEPIETYLESAGEPFDAILLMDVLEHFERAEGLWVLNRAAGRLTPGGLLVVATPGNWFEQGAVNGNELERHLSYWRSEDFEALGFSLVRDGTPAEFGHQMLLAVHTRPGIPPAP